MWRTPHVLRMSRWTWGSGEISSAKALRVNMHGLSGGTDGGHAMRLLLGHHLEPHLVGDERLLAADREPDLDLAQGPVPAHLGDRPDPVLLVLDDLAALVAVRVRVGGDRV